MTLKKLLKELSTCNDSTISNPEKITSDKLDEELLTELNINFEEVAEGYTVDLFDPKQPVKIFKKKVDAIRHLEKGDKGNGILILEGDIVHERDSGMRITFLENLFFSLEIQELMREKKIAQYDDAIEEKFIFLSPKMGKLEVGYKRTCQTTLYDKEYHLQDVYQKLLTKNDQEEFWNFFRDNFIKVAAEINDTETRFVQTIPKLQNIFDNACREFELFQNEFSFEKFRSSLEDQKEKYIKNLESNNFDLLSKVGSLPIQFGIYLFLIVRFEDKPIASLVTIVFIFIWSTFTYCSLNLLLESIDYNKERIKDQFKRIKDELKSDEKLSESVEQEHSNIKKVVSKTEIYTKRFRDTHALVSTIFVIYLLMNLYKPTISYFSSLIK